MLVRIINLEGAHLGYVWFGTDPHNNWAWDGLVRVGDDTYVIWQVFDRYSDGTYCRIRCQTLGPQDHPLLPTGRMDEFRRTNNVLH